MPQSPMPRPLLKPRRVRLPGSYSLSTTSSSGVRDVGKLRACGSAPFGPVTK